MEFREELEDKGGLSKAQIEDRVRVKRAQLTVEAEREAEKAAEAEKASSSKPAPDDARPSSTRWEIKLHLWDRLGG